MEAFAAALWEARLDLPDSIWKELKQKRKDDSIFVKAAKLMFPDLDSRALRAKGDTLFSKYHKKKQEVNDFLQV